MVHSFMRPGKLVNYSKLTKKMFRRVFEENRREITTRGYDHTEEESVFVEEKHKIKSVISKLKNLKEKYKRTLIRTSQPDQ